MAQPQILGGWATFVHRYETARTATAHAIRIPDIRPSGEVVHQPTALISGLPSMPVAFTPER